MIRLYNTMSRTVEDFEPLHDDKVSLYTCGPTVYDYPHIGNWFTYIRWDILVRTLLASGYKVDWVLNITDVGHLTSDADEGEDKLEKGAKREGKTAWDIASFYSNYFIKGLERLNFTKPQLLPKATDNISQQIELIKTLENKGLTYQISDGVYFDTSKIADYGKLARLDITSLKAGARIEYNQQKHSTTDFALWKFSPTDHQRDMEWDSPWGKGFPGWHIECSAMINKFLGDTIDIHSGGIDHIPVHHCNEIAQSESAHQKPLARYWLHSNFIKVDDQKISKSLSNGITLEDIEAKNYCLEAFRLLVLESHYRSEAHFNWDAMQAAQNRLKTYKSMAQLKFQPVESNNKVDFSINKLLSCLQDDLNTPMALSVLSDIASILLENGVSKSKLDDFKVFIEKVDELLGLNLKQETNISDEQKIIITKREEARKDKNWAESDKLRGELLKQGVAVRDTSSGTIWNRI